MTEYNAKYPRVKYLLQSYFHQMWIDLNKTKGFKDPRNFHHPLDEFVDLENHQIIKETISDLNGFVSLGLSEKELENIIRQEYFAAINAPHRGMTYAQWLEEVHDYLKAGLKNK